MRRVGGWAVAVMVGMCATAAAAQEAGTSSPAAATVDSQVQPAVDGSTPRRVAVAAGVDVASAYLFRGIFQEDSGLIVPPFADVGVTVYRGEGGLKSVAVNGGIWNSLHSGPSGSGLEGRSAWYEADYYGAMTLSVGNWKPGVLYTSYTSPNDVFGTVHEIAAVVAYDDSASPFPLNPRATLAFELSGQADGGGGREDGGGQGTYLELGVRPALAVSQHERYPVTVAIPAKLGLSLRDYYERADGSSRFGFFSLGAVASVPLAFMNGGTSWEVHGGTDVLWLGTTSRLLNKGDRIKPVAVLGVSVTY
jgi:hypothetical protein